MSATLTSPRTVLPQQSRQPYRLSVDQYQRIVQAGILGEYDRCELIEGQLVQKPMSRNPPHDSTLHKISKRLTRLLQDGWESRDQKVLVLDDSVPEPDIAVVRGSENDFDARHPAASDAFLVIEVADSSLRDDRDRARLFARNNIPVYWIVNLIDGVIEVYTQPSGKSESPAYASRQDFARGSAVPVVLDGVTVATLAVAELLP
jgi:Uma2 family endonuclease